MIGRFKKSLKAYLGHAAGFSGIYARSFRSKMTIVAFHRVSDFLPADGITCSDATFEKFCRFFKKYFSVVPLSEQVNAIREGRDMGGTLAITFDDGYRDNFEVAAPILEAAGLPATFFIATGFIESSVTPPWDKHLPVQPGWMTWDQIRQLSGRGFDIGCHTDTHIDMGSCDESTVRAELVTSKRKLEDAIGKSVELFAYPFGGREHICARSMGLVRELGFVCCASCCGGTNDPKGNPFDLNRIGIAGWFETPHQFGLELLFNRV